MKTTTLSLEEIEDLSYRALIAVGTSSDSARALAIATAATEADGVSSHGLAYIPIYAAHVQCGKVNGKAEPIITQPRASYIQVNANYGFAHRAIDAGFEKLIPAAKKNGIAALAINNSYNCGVLGYHTYRLAMAGLVGIGFTNAPASIAPSGGKKPVVGTNPFSIAVPGDDEPAILIDQSASTIAKSELIKCAREGKSIPKGWALDEDGNPTTDPELGLKGSMMPAGDYKGVGIAIMVEIMAAALSGGNLGIHASPFSGTAGGPPATGQFFIAIDPSCAVAGFNDRIASLALAVTEQSGAHLPGQKRRAARSLAADLGVKIHQPILDKIEQIITSNT